MINDSIIILNKSGSIRKKINITIKNGVIAELNIAKKQGLYKTIT